MSISKRSKTILHPEDQLTLEQLLEHLNQPQTRGLVHALVAEHSALIEVVDRYVSGIAESTPSQSSPHSAVNPAPFRQEVRQILRNAVDRWESGWDDDSISEDMQTLIANVEDFTKRGDLGNALVALEAISKACVDYWDDVDAYGAESYDVVELLDQAWTEAILCAELAASEKTDLQGKLEAWQDQLGGTFSMSLEALRQGWDYPSSLHTNQ